MRSPVPCWLTALLLLTTVTTDQVARAGPVLAIRTGDVYDHTVRVGDPPAYAYSEVDMTGGFVRRIWAFDTALVTVAGGEVREDVLLFGRSRLEYTGGLIGGGGGIGVQDQAVANVRTGFLGDLMSIHDRGTINIHGTGGANDLYLFGRGKLNVLGGSVERLHMSESSAAVISGGVTWADIGENSQLTIESGGAGEINVRGAAIRLTGGVVASLNLYGDGRLYGLGGTVERLYLVDSSAAVMSGDVWAADLYGNSKLAVEGGTVGRINVLDAATFRLSGAYTDSLVVDGDSRAVVDGGGIGYALLNNRAGLSLLNLSGSAEVVIGSPTARFRYDGTGSLGLTLTGAGVAYTNSRLRIDRLTAQDGAVVNAVGGYNGAVFAHGGTVNLIGGMVDYLEVGPDGLIRVYGTDLRLENGEWLYGRLRDGTVLNGTQVNLAGGRLEFTNAAVPEPASVALAGVGGLALLGYTRRRRK